MTLKATVVTAHVKFENYDPRAKFQRTHHPPKSKKSILDSETVVDICRLLEILVFKCEWLWAQGSFLRSQLHSHPRKRFHLRKVAKSCVKTAVKMRHVAIAAITEDNELSSYLAYANFVSAAATLDLESIEKAYEFACKSKQLLVSLKHDDDDFARRKLEDVETLLRFIEYKAKGFGIDLSTLKVEADVDAISHDLESAKINNDDDVSSKKERRKLVQVAGTAVWLSPSVVTSCKSLKARLDASLRELSKTPEEENLQLQVLYFEIERAKVEFKTALAAFLKVHRQCDAYKKLAAVKRILLRVKHAHFKAEVHAEIQNTLTLLNAFTSVYKGQLEDAEFVWENFSQPTRHVVPSLNRLFDAFDHHIRKQSAAQDDDESAIQTAAAPRKSLFAFARSLIAPAPPASSPAPKADDEPKRGGGGGFMGRLVSSFFSKQ